MRSRFYGRHIGVAVALLVTLVGCSSSTENSLVVGSDDAELVVVTTVSPITSLASDVACDRATVVGLVPEGVNSHTFEPSPSDVSTLAAADVVFVNGLNLELPTIDLALANVGQNVGIVYLGESTVTPADYIFDFSFPEEGGDPNPHLWTNPAYALGYAEKIADELADLDPANAEDYSANLARLRDRFETLDGAIRRATDTVPVENRRLLTYHDSFPYFAREYGWEVIGAIQPSDFSEPTARDVANLIDQIRDENVPAIFGSEVFSSPVLERIAAETGVQYVDELRDDDLPGAPGDPDHSYFGLMVFDFRTIVEALGGDASAFDGFPTGSVCGEDDPA